MVRSRLDVNPRVSTADPDSSKLFEARSRIRQESDLNGTTSVNAPDNVRVPALAGGTEAVAAEPAALPPAPDGCAEAATSEAAAADEAPAVLLAESVDALGWEALPPPHAESASAAAVVRTRDLRQLSAFIATNVAKAPSRHGGGRRATG
jgi:hypothetical protein